MAQTVFFFGGGQADGSAADKQLLGGKGANLAEMTRLGLPVPPGLTISTEACNHFFAQKNVWPDGMESAVRKGISKVEALTGKSFGGSENPLLFSVRSGAPVSMPGMMDTVLNLGLNDETVAALAKQSGNPRFAWDSYRRFLKMFGDVVLRIHTSRFSRVHKSLYPGIEEDELDTEQLQALCRGYKQVVEGAVGHFPADPWEQLSAAINAVFEGGEEDMGISHIVLCFCIIITIYGVGGGG